MYLKDILRFQLLFSPDSIGPIGGDPDRAIMNQQDNPDDNSDDDDKEEDKETDDDGTDKDGADDDKEDEDEEQEEDDDKEEDDEEEDDKETDEDLEAEGAIPTAAELKAAYPDIFKKFPEVRAALYRDQQYADVVGTPKEAQEIAARASTLDKIESDIFVNGDPRELLRTIKSENEEAYRSVAMNVISFLQETDKDLYYEVAAMPLKQVLRAAFRDGNGDKSDLGRAAQYIHKYYFNNTDMNAKVKIEDGIKPKEKTREQVDYEKRLAQLDERDYTNFKNSVDNSYVNRMSSTIREALDKDERINDYMKSKIISDVLGEIRDQLNQDKRYLTQMNTLFKTAQANGYTGDYKSRILSTALARAKSLTPSIRAKVVANALGQKKRDKDKDKQETPRREQRRESRSSGSQNRSSDRRDAPKKPQSDLDVIRG